MNKIDLSTLQQLAGVPDLIKEVVTSFKKAPEVFSNPKFLLSLVKSVVEVAAAPDDESRRKVIQIQIARIQKEFA
ncbi:hypothetical protein [Deinococcus humi]|uniref:Uncharacterized protein n=1 Tax=Deinococcus humi TaxID=662880 RepID=A0A7W8JSP2_9DEIO|nr:hypothetical protein [Deinococcus humi]MBB5362048.1 hypothetical protein [Deinococcus humi]GGO22325.1 hypothetical protein GCM10008949_09470 [Deinococcus humi]